MIRTAIQNASKKENQRIIFITSYVGQKSIWKHEQNMYKIDKKYQLKKIPTLYEYNTPKFLIENECKQIDLIDAFLENSS